MAEKAESRQLESESRYELFDEIASGGMATVHVGRLVGAVGFARTVAIKRLHPHLSRDADFVSMFVDEAHLAARIRHPNVVGTLDVLRGDDELLLVMEYIHGESLGGLARAARERGERLPPAVAVSIVSGALFGLHAAHEAKDERGVPLGIVHRDVSPVNVLVGVDGVARVLDFGIAKANVRVQSTREGQMKGKLRYMAPEQLCDEPVTCRSDVYAASVMLWETLTGERLFWASNEGAIVAKVLEGAVPPPGRLMEDLPPALDEVVMKGLSRRPEARFATAREMALALERALSPAPAHAVGEWVERTAGEVLRMRAERIARIEAAAEGGPAAAPAPAYEVTVARTLTALAKARPESPPARTRSIVTSVASPHALRAAIPSEEPPVASPHAAVASPPRTITQPLEALPPALVEVPRSATIRIQTVDAADEATQRAQRKRTRRLATATVAVSVVAMLLVGLVALAASFRSSSGTDAAAQSSVPPPSPSAAASAVAIATQAAIPPIPAPPEPAEPSASVATASVGRPSRAAPRVSAAPSAARPSAPDCDPPYVEDANGRRHVKRECL